jgi:hypothetical protein
MSIVKKISAVSFQYSVNSISYKYNIKDFYEENNIFEFSLLELKYSIKLNCEMLTKNGKLLIIFSFFHVSLVNREF